MEGLANSQERVLLLWTSKESCIKTDIDKCCVWDDFAENVMNPLHDDYDRNVITREGSGGILCSSEFINECAKEAINNDENIFSLAHNKITNPVKNWPLQNEIRYQLLRKHKNLQICIIQYPYSMVQIASVLLTLWLMASIALKYRKKNG